MRGKIIPSLSTPFDLRRDFTFVLVQQSGALYSCLSHASLLLSCGQGQQSPFFLKASSACLRGLGWTRVIVLFSCHCSPEPGAVQDAQEVTRGASSGSGGSSLYNSLCMTDTNTAGGKVGAPVNTLLATTATRNGQLITSLLAFLLCFTSSTHAKDAHKFLGQLLVSSFSSYKVFGARPPTMSL